MQIPEEDIRHLITMVRDFARLPTNRLQTVLRIIEKDSEVPAVAFNRIHAVVTNTLNDRVTVDFVREWANELIYRAQQEWEQTHTP